jgi:hypothetical protein
MDLLENLTTVKTSSKHPRAKVVAKLRATATLPMAKLYGLSFCSPCGSTISSLDFNPLWSLAFNSTVPASTLSLFPSSDLFLGALAAHDFCQLPDFMSLDVTYPVCASRWHSYLQNIFSVSRNSYCSLYCRVVSVYQLGTGVSPQPSTFVVLVFVFSRLFDFRDLTLGYRSCVTYDISDGRMINHSTHSILTAYQKSAYKERFRGGDFGFAYVGRYSSGINFRHYSVIILDGGCTLHRVAYLTLLSNYHTDVPSVRTEGIGGEQLFFVGRGDLAL